MKREATVKKHAGKLMAEIIRQEACGDCHACDFGRKEAMYYPLPDGHFEEGDKVFVEISDRALGRATLIAYGLPLVCLLAGLLLGSLLFSAEWLQALTALIFLLIGWSIIRATEKKRKNSETFTCRAGRIQQAEEENL